MTEFTLRVLVLLALAGGISCVVSSTAVAQHHSADLDENQMLSLSEILRVIQLYNAGAYHCDGASEDGFGPGLDAQLQGCTGHDSDYMPRDWRVSLSELLRLIQLFNMGAYHTQCEAEDGFGPGSGALADCEEMPEGEGEVVERSALGMNLAAPTHSSDVAFVNLMHQTHGFLRESDYTLMLDDLDASGWPTRVSEPLTVSLMGWGGELSPYMPAGDYILLYEGQGTLLVDGAEEVAGSRTVEGNTTRVLYRYAPADGGIFLRLMATDPEGTGNYLRNIRFILPGHEQDYAQQIFNPAFLEAWEEYSCFRHVQSMQIWPFQEDLFDDSFPVRLDEHWSERARMEDFRWGYRWSYDLAVELSNRLDAEIWITIPHTATREYVEQLAQFLIERLEPGLTVYAEYTNEPWNFMSATWHWLRDEGLSEGLGTVPGMGTTDDASIIALRKYMQLAVEYMEIFDAAFAAAGRGDDLVKVIGGNENTYHYTEDEDGVVNGNELGALYYPVDGRPAYTYFDAWGTTSYVGGMLGFERQRTVADWSEDELFTFLRTGVQPDTDTPDEIIPLIPGTDIREGTLDATVHAQEEMAAFAERFGLHHVVYEGGPHLVALPWGYDETTGEDYELTDDEFQRIDGLFNEAIVDERFGQMMTDLLDGARDAGVTLHVMFNSCELAGETQWGKFGFLQHIFQDPATSPKYVATEAWMRANPRWWGSLQADGM